MTPERIEKFKSVAKCRQGNLTVVLENVHDPHNIGAVLRSCDSVGIMEIFVLFSESHLDRERLELGKNASSGARKWIDVHFYTDTKACFEHVRSKYKNIISTHLGKESVSLHQLDMTGSIALVFGNERDGLSDAALAHSDGNFIIPQVGMVQSLNISVACAVTLYEAYRQRLAKGFYNDNNTLTSKEQNVLFDKFANIHQSREGKNSVERLNE